MVISPAKARLQTVFANGIAANPTSKELVEQLQEHINGASLEEQPAEIMTETGDVVFAVELDGFCYTLTRSCAQIADLSVNLSGREQEIARLVARGLPNKAIAAVLEISPWTVSTHLRRIFAKLDVSTRAEMVASVLKEGLLGDNVTI
jgi:two-component system nitrate/nitrite response regulator NarL